MSLHAAFNLSVEGFDATPRLNLDVTTLEFNHEAVMLITGSLALEAQYGAALRGVQHGAVEDHLALVFRILEGNTCDLFNVVSVPTLHTPRVGGFVVLRLVTRFCDVAYRRFALTAQGGAA